MFHQAPDLAVAMRSEVGELREINALRLTPPTTTMAATLQMRSCASRSVSLRPAALRNRATVKLNRSTSGAGPDARPPKVLSLAPAGRTLLTSHDGTSPVHSIASSCLNALAHPTLESATTITESVSWNSSATMGSLATSSRSQLKPTPVPQSRMYMHSSKARGWSTLR